MARANGRASVRTVGQLWPARAAGSPRHRSGGAAEFYWPYAALAAEVYQTRGETDVNTAVALASPWLREQVLKHGNDTQKTRYRNMRFPEAASLFREGLESRCLDERKQLGVDAQDPNQPQSCMDQDDARRATEEATATALAEPNRSTDNEPAGQEDCKYSPDHEPRVPVKKVADEQGWSRVHELHKQTAARGWRLFVPELAIDVWRRERSSQDKPLEMEYAIVYRGTVGGGGWVSNLRGLTAMIPFVWDQYRQAAIATDAIIDQVLRLHALADSLLGRDKPTALRFTAVGHSLGGGLAQYIYLRTPRITRVVAFDPSPINGASLIPFEGRAKVTEGGRRFVDFDPRDKMAAMHLLYEKGEIISLVAPCHSGPLWGDEGGPWILCESVNYAHGNTFHQHNMAQLACRLYVTQRDKAKPAGVQP